MSAPTPGDSAALAGAGAGPGAVRTGVVRAAIRAARALALSYLIETTRSRTALFFTFAFPQLFLLVFGYVFAGGEAQRVAYLMPGVLTITTISLSFFGYSMHLVSERERGALRRLRVTPASAAAVVLGQYFHALFALGFALLFQLLLGKLLFRFPFSGSPVALAAMLAAGALAFVALGLVVGCVSRDTRTAPALTNLIFFPMMFLSGSAMPFFALPEWVQQVARFLPATYVNEGLQRALIQSRGVGGEYGVAAPVAALLAYGVAGLILNALLFRWESTDRLVPKRLALALLILGAVVVGVALFGPELTMARKPG
jgi:ABC-2 type transport system permease protein